MKCPDCENGYVNGWYERMACTVCNGTNELPKDITYDPDRGKSMKIQRQKGNESLSAYCIRSKKDIKQRSEEERGFFRRG